MNVKEEVAFNFKESDDISLNELKDSVSYEMNSNVMVERSYALITSFISFCLFYNVITSTHNITNDPCLLIFASMILFTGFKFLFSCDLCLFRSKKKMFKEGKKMITDSFLKDNNINKEIADCMISDILRSGKEK